MKRLTGPGVVPTGEMVLPMIWNRLKAIEDVLGEEYDLERLKHLVTGDNFTAEDMSAAYTSGYEIGRKQGEDKTCGPCPAIHAVKAMAASDLVPVVRCKDCVHRRSRPHCAGRPMDWYCPEGVRRRDND